MKMARQLKGLDEASLMSLWQEYADRVRRFEPSERWEEACLVFGMIQAVRFKNQLFNHHWAEGGAAGQTPEAEPDSGAGVGQDVDTGNGRDDDRSGTGPAAGSGGKRGKLIRFPSGDGDES